MLRELDHRESDGISVTLYVETDTLSPVVGLTDKRTELEAQFAVPADKALDAFQHPFSYMDSVKIS